jgi:hypothetical protein
MGDNARHGYTTSFIDDFLGKKFWSYGDLVFHHTGMTRVDDGRQIKNNVNPYFYEYVNPNARPNPTDGYMSLNHVCSGSEEFEKVKTMASSRPFEGVIAGVLRVQNYNLWTIFTDFTKKDPYANICVGFHSTNFNPFLENILLNGLNPAVSQVGRYGVGSYLAIHAAMSLDYYSTVFTTPLFQDQDGKPCIDSYKIVNLFFCNRGEMAFVGETTIPHGFGSFANNTRQPSVLCLQEYERLCPAYVLIYRMTPPRLDDGELQYDVECALEKGLSPDTSGEWCWPSETIGAKVFAAVTRLF